MNNTFDKNIWVFLSLQWWKPHLLKYFSNQLLEKIDPERIKTWVWQLHFIISFNSSWYGCNLQQSRKNIFFYMSGLLAPLIGDTKTTQRSQTRNYLKYPCQKLSEQTSNDLKEILTSFTHVTYFFRKSISFFKIKPMLLYLHVILTFMCPNLN